MRLDARSGWLALAVGVVAGWVAAAPPAWWTNRGVLTTNAPNDYAPATAGQLKHIASKAKDELDYSLNDGAGTAVAARVASFLNTNNYAAINLGQIKHVAQPFYERINAQGIVTGYPWTVTTTTDDMNFAAANLGQLKNVFSFDFDTDGDGMSDWWEMQQWTSLTNSGTGDSDNDGLLNNEEYVHRTNPNNGDTDGDGVSDSDELAMEMDPLVAIGVGYPVSFKIDSNCGKIYFVSTEVGTGPRWGHLVNMAETTESEARMGTLVGATCDARYGPDTSGYGNDKDTYTTIFRNSPTSLLIQVDCYTNAAGRTYTGRLKLYRGYICNWTTARLENVAYPTPPPTSTCSVARSATNEITWSMFLDASGGIGCLSVNYRPVRKHPFEVHLRAANGVDPMPRLFAANSTTLVRAVISPLLSGNYYWSATGGGLTFASNGVALVPIVAGATASSAIDDKSIICAFTPTNTSLTCGTNALATVLKIDFTKLSETANPANYIFNPTPKDDPPPVLSNRLYATESPVDSRYHVTLEVNDQPASMRSLLMHAVYSGSTKLTTGEGFFPSAGPADIVFDHPTASAASVTDFEIKVGHDLNGNGALDANEILCPLEVKDTSGRVIGPPMVRGASEIRYGEASVAVVVEIAANPNEHARELLRIFRDGSTAGVPPSKQPSALLSGTTSFNCFSGDFSEWITHNAGAPFSSAGSATIPYYVWDAASSLGNLVGTSEQIQEAGESFYNTGLVATITAYFATQTNGHVATFPLSGGFYAVPHVSESPGWSFTTVTFGIAWWPDSLDDINGTIGRGRLPTHEAQYTVERKSILGIFYNDVIQVRYRGVVEDLYDFNYEAGLLAGQPAVLQIGHGNGSYGTSRAPAQIFRDRILFDVTIPDPF